MQPITTRVCLYGRGVLKQVAGVIKGGGEAYEKEIVFCWCVYCFDEFAFG